MCFIRALLDVYNPARRQCKGRMRWETRKPWRHTTHRTRATLTSRQCKDGRPSRHLLSGRRGGDCMSAGQLASTCIRVTLRVGPVCVWEGGVCVCARDWCLVVIERGEISSDLN